MAESINNILPPSSFTIIKHNLFIIEAKLVAFTGSNVSLTLHKILIPFLELILNPVEPQLKSLEPSEPNSIPIYYLIKD